MGRGKEWLHVWKDNVISISTTKIPPKQRFPFATTGICLIPQCLSSVLLQMHWIVVTNSGFHPPCLKFPFFLKWMWWTLLYSLWHSMNWWIKVQSPPLFERKCSSKERNTSVYICLFSGWCNKKCERYMNNICHCVFTVSCWGLGYYTSRQHPFGIMSGWY